MDAMKCMNKTDQRRITQYPSATAVILFDGLVSKESDQSISPLLHITVLYCTVFGCTVLYLVVLYHTDSGLGPPTLSLIAMSST